VHPIPNSAGPIFSPDGRLVIFNGAPLDDPRKYDWWVAPVDGGEPWSSGANKDATFFDIVSFPSIWLPGQLLIIAGTTIEGMNIYRVPISDDGHISGSVEPLTTGPGMSWAPSVSDVGRITLSRFNWIVHLWEVSLDPETGRSVGAPRRVTDDAAPKFYFSLSNNGDRLIYSAFSGSRNQHRNAIHLQDRSTGAARVLVDLTVQAVSLYPRLSGDGSFFCWRHRVDGQQTVWIAPVDEPVGQELCRGCFMVDFFSDGDHVLVDWGRRLSRLGIADGVDSTILELEERALLRSDLSPDDRWLAVQAGEPDGSISIYAVPVRETPAPREEWVEIVSSTVWAGSPRWSTDGSTLYYISERDDFVCVWGQSLDPTTKVPQGEAFPVAHAHRSSMIMLGFAKHMWNLEVGGDRLVFNAGEITGDVYTAMLELED
jgi:hypothetical protein